MPTVLSIMGQNCLTRFVLDMLQPCSFKNEVEGEPPPMLSRDCFFLTTCLDSKDGRKGASTNSADS